MNEVEKYVINNFKEENKYNDEYIYLNDDEILKLNPVTAYDYIDYYDRLILELNKNIVSCQNSIREMENDMPKDYILKKETLEYIKEELDEIRNTQEKINNYMNIKNKYLEQVKNEHIK